MPLAKTSIRSVFQETAAGAEVSRPLSDSQRCHSPSHQAWSRVSSPPRAKTSRRLAPREETAGAERRTRARVTSVTVSWRRPLVAVTWATFVTVPRRIGSEPVAVSTRRVAPVFKSS